jgi:acyl carrier protein
LLFLEYSMNELVTILNEIRPGQDFAGAEDFFAQGVLDSIDLTLLVSALESRYNIFVDVDEIVPANLSNVKAIEAFLARKGVNL